MRYKGQAIEIIGSKTVFGKETLWIRILEDGSFAQILREELDDDIDQHDDLSIVRYTAVAARIKEEISKKRILAPYESSLIPLPHQILVLEKVMQATQTRFLLADEVGMGKTIEAGLVLKELKLRGEIKRTLLIVPKSAMIQWQSELKEHFKENFHIYDSELIGSLTRTFSRLDAEEELNFWKQHNQIIISTDAIKPLETRQGWSQEKIDEYNKYRLESVVNAEFDLVIIDEAHKMGGSTSQVSRFQLADALSNAVPNILLLSATPHRGKSDHFRRVLQLIDADAFVGEGMPSIEEIEPYVMRSEKRCAVDYDGNKLFNARTTTKIEITLEESSHYRQIQLYDNVTEYVRTSFNKAKRSGRNALGLVMIMLQKIASSSTAAIASALRTRLWRLENGIEDSLNGYDCESISAEDLAEIAINDFSVEANSDHRTEEDVLRDLIQEADDCLRNEVDAKTTTLISLINDLRVEENNPNLKILVFTEFRATQAYIANALEQVGLSCVAINGSMDMDTRHSALIQFKESADVMIATDAAGESLNMQFCHIAVNYDLPWNPMAIEQRIGRVDRIGQKYPVKAYNLLTSNSVDSRVYGIIVEKLDIIMSELGIDKTSDVLDSTIEMKRVNDLYLKSLLDPKRFEFASDSWLIDIRRKLNNYKSTEGALPTLAEEQINAQAAAEVKYSPLPIWLEEMLDLYTKGKGGRIEKDLYGSVKYHFNTHSFTGVFDSAKTVDNPAAEHLTLQSPIIKKVLDEIDGGNVNDIKVIRSHNGEETAGFLSIWKVYAINPNDTRITYSAQFVADNGRVYGAYANDLWNKLVQEPNYFYSCGSMPYDNTNDEILEPHLFNVFHQMENIIKEGLHTKAENKLKALNFTISRAERIGIENIRKARLRKLQEEKMKWNTVFSRESNVVPDLKHIITIRIDG